MTFSHQLMANTGPIDAFVFSDDVANSYFWYYGYTTVKNNFPIFLDIMPDGGSAPAFGSESNFKLPLQHDRLGPIQLVLDVSALATTGGTFRRFVDFLGFEIASSIELLYSSQEIYTLTPENFWDYYVRLNNISSQDSEAELVAGDKTVVQRDILATGVQRLVIDLPFPHTRGTSHWLEILSLAQEPRIRINWRPLAHLVQTDGTVPVATISNVFLRCHYSVNDGDERDANQARVQSEDGIIRLFEDFRQENLTIPAGSTGEVRLEIRNLRTSTKRLSFILRLDADLTTDLARQYFENLQGIVSFRFEAADGRIIYDQEDVYNRFYYHSLYHPEAPSGRRKYEFCWALAPDDLLNATGSFNFGNKTNPILVINVGTVPTAAMTVTVMANEYNTIQIVRGDMLKNFK